MDNNTKDKPKSQLEKAIEQLNKDVEEEYRQKALEEQARDDEYLEYIFEEAGV